MAKNAVIIKTRRLVLRPLEPGDAETAHEYAGDAENTKYMIYLPSETISDTEQLLRAAAAEWEKESPGFYEFAVILDERHIGAVSIYPEDDRQECEIGWILNKAYHCNGYATEAVRAVLDFAVNELKIKKINAHCDHRNVSSRRVMEKAGLTFESDAGMRRNKGSEEDVPEFSYSLIVK